MTPASRRWEPAVRCALRVVLAVAFQATLALAQTATSSDSPTATAATATATATVTPSAAGSSTVAIAVGSAVGAGCVLAAAVTAAVVLSRRNRHSGSPKALDDCKRDPEAAVSGLTTATPAQAEPQPIIKPKPQVQFRTEPPPRRQTPPLPLADPLPSATCQLGPPDAANDPEAFGSPTGPTGALWTPPSSLGGHFAPIGLHSRGLSSSSQSGVGTATALLHAPEKEKMLLRSATAELHGLAPAVGSSGSMVIIPAKLPAAVVTPAPTTMPVHRILQVAPKPPSFASLPASRLGLASADTLNQHATPAGSVAILPVATSVPALYGATHDDGLPAAPQPPTVAAVTTQAPPTLRSDSGSLQQQKTPTTAGAGPAYAPFLPIAGALRVQRPVSKLFSKQKRMSYGPQVAQHERAPSQTSRPLDDAQCDRMSSSDQNTVPSATAGADSDRSQPSLSERSVGAERSLADSTHPQRSVSDFGLGAGASASGASAPATPSCDAGQTPDASEPVRSPSSAALAPVVSDASPLGAPPTQPEAKAAPKTVPKPAPPRPAQERPMPTLGRLMDRLYKKMGAASANADATLANRYITVNDHGDLTLGTPQRVLSYPAFAEIAIDTDIRLMEKVGEGGFGEVFRAAVENPALAEKWRTGGAHVAVKRAKVSAGEEKNTVSRKRRQQLEERALADFMQEVSICYVLQKYPNIVKLYGCARTPYLVTITRLYCGSLMQYLHHQLPAGSEPWRANLEGGLPWPMIAAGFAHDLAHAVHAMHCNSFAHLDIKPGNLLIERTDGRPHPLVPGSPWSLILTDFGLTRVLDAQREEVRGRKAANAGGLSFRYAAPEAFEILYQRPGRSAGAIDPQVYTNMDIYATGVTLYHCLTREQPWGPKATMQSVQAAVKTGERPRAVYSQPSGDVAQQITALVQRCWKQVATERLSASELTLAIEHELRPVVSSGCLPGGEKQAVAEVSSSAVVSAPVPASGGQSEPVPPPRPTAPPRSPAVVEQGSPEPKPTQQADTGTPANLAPQSTSPQAAEETNPPAPVPAPSNLDAGAEAKGTPTTAPSQLPEAPAPAFRDCTELPPMDYVGTIPIQVMNEKPRENVALANGCRVGIPALRTQSMLDAVFRPPTRLFGATPVADAAPKADAEGSHDVTVRTPIDYALALDPSRMLLKTNSSSTVLPQPLTAQNSTVTVDTLVPEAPGKALVAAVPVLPALPELQSSGDGGPDAPDAV